MLTVAAGDEIRVLVRNDRLGVINGTTANVTRVDHSHDGDSDELESGKIRVRLAGREVTFNTSEFTDQHGRVKVTYAYASTIASVQGLTYDRAVVLTHSSASDDARHCAGQS